ncbi:MAG: MBOAT family protein, partial [Victivallales bacterium]|nr:MBOAT family protein [Victivallales bacterium]
MQFQSWTFLFFFIPVLLLYWAVRGTRLRIPVLLVASYVFYASFNVYFLICLGVVTIVDYLVALQLSRHRSRWLVCVSLLVDLGMLCSFKYIPRVTDFDWVLPVGLSFFTFKSISYVIDVYRGKIAVERNLLSYAAYVAFFPQLVAGPIDRATTLLPQLRHNVPLRIDDVSEGFSLFVTGLFKKAVMADMLAVYVNVMYEDVTSYSGAMRLLAAYAYAWQIYFDFSGYSDMACGIARCMGFRCMLNFNNPYVSVDVRDFWRRWHI